MYCLHIQLKSKAMPAHSSEAGAWRMLKHTKIDYGSDSGVCVSVMQRLVHMLNAA